MDKIRLYKISQLQEALKNIGICYSLDQLRKLERKGIVFTTHVNNSTHRLFNQEQFEKSVRNVAYYFMGATIPEIKANGEVLKARGRKILKVAKSLSK